MPLSELEKKERRRLTDKKYFENNKEKIAERQKKYYENNLEKIKEYNQSPKRIKDKRISNWRRSGIIDPDLKSVYDYFITQTNCWICDKEYNKVNKMDLRCLDHDHDLTDEPNIRYICCNYCNLNIIIK
tara:strand:+ start:12 stop:398 length:387 start_codon:yes stop_codon:yes gene_type:complete